MSTATTRVVGISWACAIPLQAPITSASASQHRVTIDRIRGKEVSKPDAPLNPHET